MIGLVIKDDKNDEKKYLVILFNFLQLPFGVKYKMDSTTLLIIRSKKLSGLLVCLDVEKMEERSFSGLNTLFVFLYGRQRNTYLFSLLTYT